MARSGQLPRPPGRFRAFVAWLEEYQGAISAVAATVASTVAVISVSWGIWSHHARDRVDDAHEKADVARHVAVSKQINKLAGAIEAEISDMQDNMKEYVKSSNEDQSSETVRKIIASHEDPQRAREEVYQKALYEARMGEYIYEIDQAAGEAGFFVTSARWKRGEPNEPDWKGTSFLLTLAERTGIDSCLGTYFKRRETGNSEGEYVNMDTQKELFRFLLRESCVGELTEPLEFEIQYTHLGQKTEVLERFAKLGVVIGYIGDKMAHYEQGR